jgi:hypothetical protein
MSASPPTGSGILAHSGIPGPAPFVATALFFAGFGVGWAAFVVLRGRPAGVRRVAGLGLGALAFACFAIATAVPLLIHATPTITLPRTTARLRFVAPAPDSVVVGDPAVVPIVLDLEGGKLVPFSSLHLVPNEGHIHLYLDGRLVSMTSAATADVSVAPGTHRLTAEFVAVDHGPFQPRVRASVAFLVRP